MTGLIPGHRHVTHRGRSFHFVFGEALEADVRRRQPAIPARWYLVSLIGHRWPAIPFDAAHTDAELDGRLAEWLDSAVFARAESEPVAAPSDSRACV